jgi:hypothetical protein
MTLEIFLVLALLVAVVASFSLEKVPVDITTILECGGCAVGCAGGLGGPAPNHVRQLDSIGAWCRGRGTTRRSSWPRPDSAKATRRVCWLACEDWPRGEGGDPRTWGAFEVIGYAGEPLTAPALPQRRR